MKMYYSIFYKWDIQIISSTFHLLPPGEPLLDLSSISGFHLRSSEARLLSRITFIRYLQVIPEYHLLTVAYRVLNQVFFTIILISDNNVISLFYYVLASTMLVDNKNKWSKHIMLLKDCVMKHSLFS